MKLILIPIYSFIEKDNLVISARFCPARGWKVRLLNLNLLSLSYRWLYRIGRTILTKLSFCCEVSIRIEFLLRAVDSRLACWNWATGGNTPRLVLWSSWGPGMEMYGGDFRNSFGWKESLFSFQPVQASSAGAGQSHCVCVQALTKLDHIIPDAAVFISSFPVPPLLPCCTVGRGWRRVGSGMAFQGACLSLP